jgi:transcription antitermination protein NusB
MASRHRSREHALQILFQWDMRKQPVDESMEAFYGSLFSEESAVAPPRDEFLEQLVRGTVDKAGEIDALISSHAEHWRIERMPAVDRNILRLAIYEMRHTETPAAVVIDEALELARRFSTEESVQFVNGVLDAVHRGAAGTA